LHKRIQHTQNGWNDKNAVIHQAFWEWNEFLWRTGWGNSQDLVKSAGQNKQRQLSKFARQTAHQYYNMMLSTHAVQYITEDSDCLIQAGTEHVAQQQYTDTDGEDNVAIHLSGEYELEVTPEVQEKINMDDTIDIVWLMGNSKKNNNRKFKLKRELVHCLYRKIKESRV
jgi:hypothetical protein